jgi:hypothetical protein
MSELAFLINLSHASKLLAECRTLPELKQYRDMAEAMRQYAKAQHLGLEAQNHAAEFKIRAGRGMGELLGGIPKQHGGVRDGMGLQNETPLPATLADLDITKTESHRWQKIASIPEDEFEQYIAEVKAEKKELTTAGVYRLALRRDNVVEISRLREQPVTVPSGKYRCIVIDPPLADAKNRTRRAAGQEVAVQDG